MTRLIYFGIFIKQKYLKFQKFEPEGIIQIKVLTITSLSTCPSLFVNDLTLFIEKL